MAWEMTAQFAGTLAIFRLPPPAQRCRRSHREAGLGAVRVEQSVRGEPRHIAPIPFLGVVVHAVGRQANLIHGEGLRFERNILPCELQLSFEGREIGRERPPEIPWGWRSGLLREQRRNTA
jgi:hypothetical protein